MERSTVEVYERSALAYRDSRAPGHSATPARAFRRAVGGATRRAGVRVDLGCGPGLDAPHLGRPLVLADAARAMLELARGAAPHGLAVQADLESPPFRPASLDGVWAAKTYQHLPPERVPLALARLHAALRPDAPFHLSLIEGEGERVHIGTDIPGRYFALWPRERLVDVLLGAGFSVDSLQATGDRSWMRVRSTRAATLPDFVGPGMRVLVCGLNPSVHAVAAGYGYAGPSNRFWPAALAAGLVTRARNGVTALVEEGVGMTDLVKRATPRASALTAQEFREGAQRVERLVAWLRPERVCFVGLAGYRAAVHRGATAGWQAEPFAGVPCYVLPSTSGLNAATSLAALTRGLRDLAGTP